MSEIAQYQGFLERWRTEIGDPRIQRQSEFIDAFNRFRDEYVNRKAEVEKVSLFSAPSYNIFKLLGVTRDELRYSTFLANLLDPNESHGQGFLFLRTFLDYCGSRFSEFPFSLDIQAKGRWSVIPELGISTGRLDIAILNAECSALLLIENKLYAYEQTEQLARYWNWMENKKEDFRIRALIFLTISGYEAASSGGHPYYRLSYHQDIPEWLEPVIEKIQAPGVREVVRQYMEITHVL